MLTRLLDLFLEAVIEVVMNLLDQILVIKGSEIEFAFITHRWSPNGTWAQNRQTLCNCCASGDAPMPESDRCGKRTRLAMACTPDHAARTYHDRCLSHRIRSRRIPRPGAQGRRPTPRLFRQSGRNPGAAAGDRPHGRGAGRQERQSRRLFRDHGRRRANWSTTRIRPVPISTTRRARTRSSSART